MIARTSTCRTPKMDAVTNAVQYNQSPHMHRTAPRFDQVNQNNFALKIRQFY